MQEPHRSTESGSWKLDFWATFSWVRTSSLLTSLNTSDQPVFPNDLEDVVTHEISALENDELTPTEEEIYATLRRMSPDKAPRPDGMTVLFFYQFLAYCWP